LIKFDFCKKIHLLFSGLNWKNSGKIKQHPVGPTVNFKGTPLIVAVSPTMQPLLTRGFNIEHHTLPTLFNFLTVQNMKKLVFVCKQNHGNTTTYLVGVTYCLPRTYNKTLPKGPGPHSPVTAAADVLQGL